MRCSLTDKLTAAIQHSVQYFNYKFSFVLHLRCCNERHISSRRNCCRLKLENVFHRTHVTMENSYRSLKKLMPFVSSTICTTSILATVSSGDIWARSVIPIQREKKLFCLHESLLIKRNILFEEKECISMHAGFHIQRTWASRMSHSFSTFLKWCRSACLKTLMASVMPQSAHRICIVSKDVPSLWERLFELA